MMIEISVGTAADVGQIMPIMEQAFAPEYGEAWTAGQCLSTLSLPYSQLWLASAAGETIGFAISRWVLDEEELLMIGIASGHLRKGVGSSLLDQIVDHASHAGRKTLFLEVRDGNPAIDFYMKHQFVAIGRRCDYYSGSGSDKFDAITMKRILTVVD